MGWKYIMVENHLSDGLVVAFPVIFPDKMVHSQVLVQTRRIMPGWHANGCKCVSAGKIEHVNVLGLGGDSETLSLNSRPEDADIIRLYSYLHGIKS